MLQLYQLNYNNVFGIINLFSTRHIDLILMYNFFNTSLYFNTDIKHRFTDLIGVPCKINGQDIKVLILGLLDRTKGDSYKDKFVSNLNFVIVSCFSYADISNTAYNVEEACTINRRLVLHDASLPACQSMHYKT
jgi:hypothetical protein